VAALVGAVVLDRDNVVGHAGLSICLPRTGDQPGALAAGKRWAELDPENASAHYALGCKLSNANQFEASIEPFRRASELNPTFAEAHCNLGAALMRTGTRDASALAALERSIEINPDLVQGHNNLANLLESQGNWEAVLTHHRKLAALLPDDPVHQTNLAGTLVRTGHLVEAAGQFEKALAMRPDHADAHNAAAWMLGSPPVPDSVAKQAAKFAERAVALVPEEGAFHNTLGVARYRAGAHKQAIEALEASMRLQALRSSHDLLFLAMAQWRLGRKAEARASYDEAVAWMKARSEKDEELKRFHAEARALLEVEAQGDK
jgi:protein O-GlcNAc transferase